MSTNPFESGVFYEGEFVTEQARFRFDNPLRDQRQCLMMEIEPIRQASLLGFAIAFVGESGYYIDQAGVLQSFSDSTTFPNTNDIRWIFLGGAPQPSYLVMIDETGGARYVTSTFPPDPLALSASATRPLVPGGINSAKFVGRYLELLAEDGHSFYRMTVDSANVIHFDFERDEPWRIQSINIQNGHPYLYHNGRTWIEALIRLGDVTTQVPISDLGYGGVSIPRVGTIEISLHDEFFDFLTWQDWDGRDFTIWLGSTDESPTLYPVLLRGKTAAASWNENTISIDIADAGILLNRHVQINSYAGTGGLEGDAELEGKLKPLLLGFVPLLEPVLVNRALWIYQFHDGPAFSHGLISQGGVSLTSLGDFPGGLESWQPTPNEVDTGGYRTDLGAGMFRLAGPPGGRVTMRVPGGASDMPLSTTISDIVQWVAQRRLPDTPIDTNSFVLHRQTFLRSLGIYITEAKTLQQLFNEFMVPVGGTIGLNGVGELYIRTLQRVSPVAHIMEEDISDGSLSRSSPPQPGTIHKFGFQRSYVSLTESDLLGQARDDIRAFGLEEYRYIIGGPYTDPVANRFPSAPTKIINTHFMSAFDAAQTGFLFVYREQALRDVFTLTVSDYSWLFQIGDNVLLQYPRWGLDVPRQCVVVGITERSPTAGSDDENGENQTSLILWG